MIMNRLRCEGRMLKYVAEVITGFIPLGHEDIEDIVKGLLLFVYINNKKNIFCFFVK